MPWDVGAFRAERKGKFSRWQACTCAARNGLWFAQIGFGNAGKPVSSLNPQRAFLGFVRGLKTEVLHSASRRDIWSPRSKCRPPVELGCWQSLPDHHPGVSTLQGASLQRASCSRAVGPDQAYLPIVEWVSPSWYCVTLKNLPHPWHFRLPVSATTGPPGDLIVRPFCQSSNPSQWHFGHSGPRAIAISIIIHLVVAGFSSGHHPVTLILVLSQPHTEASGAGSCSCATFALDCQFLPCGPQ